VKKINYIGMFIVMFFFLLFFIIATFFLDRRNPIDNRVETENDISYENKDFDMQVNIINSLYEDIKILYDVVNNKFKVDHDDVIIIDDITYKRITNFNEVMDKLFTLNGRNKYINDLGNYFAYSNNNYYLAGNFVSYQTYYFRGDNTNIYVTSANENEINGIIYEKWTSNNKNTLATIRVLNVQGNWVVDDVTLLSTE